MIDIITDRKKIAEAFTLLEQATTSYSDTIVTSLAVPKQLLREAIDISYWVLTHMNRAMNHIKHNPITNAPVIDFDLDDTYMIYIEFSEDDSYYNVFIEAMGDIAEDDKNTVELHRIYRIDGSQSPWYYGPKK